MKKGLKFILYVFIALTALGLIVALFDKEDTQTGIESNISTRSVKSNWYYSSNINEMDDSYTYYARIDAEDKLSFDFPYGKETATIVVRNREGSNEVILAISNGQFMPSFSYEKTIRIRFDSDKAKQYSYVIPSDGRTNEIFIEKPESLIDRLKQSKECIIEAEFFNEGVRTVKFKCEGLAWEH